MKKFIILLFTLLICNLYGTTAQSEGTKPASASQAVNNTQSSQGQPVQYITVMTPIDIVSNPNTYLNKKVQFKAKFNKFSILGLDYPKINRPSTKYIAILIDRDDMGGSVPLSELKIFLKRADAEKLMDLDAGDRIEIKGEVFSTALNDPWMDVDKLIVLTPKNTEKK